MSMPISSPVALQLLSRLAGTGLLLLAAGCSNRPAAVETGPKKLGPNYTPLALVERDGQVRQANFEAAITRDSVAFPDPGEQELAAQALGRIGSPAVPMLVNSLQHRDAAVRRQSALVLARIGPEAKDAVPALINALDDPETSVRRAAARALGQIGPEAKDAVPALMRSLVQPPQ